MSDEGEGGGGGRTHHQLVVLQPLARLHDAHDGGVALVDALSEDLFERLRRLVLRRGRAARGRRLTCRRVAHRRRQRNLHAPQPRLELRIHAEGERVRGAMAQEQLVGAAAAGAARRLRQREERRGEGQQTELGLLRRQPRLLRHLRDGQLRVGGVAEAAQRHGLEQGHVEVVDARLPAAGRREGGGDDRARQAVAPQQAPALEVRLVEAREAALQRLQLERQAQRVVARRLRLRPVALRQQPQLEGVAAQRSSVGAGAGAGAVAEQGEALRRQVQVGEHALELRGELRAALGLQLRQHRALQLARRRLLYTTTRARSEHSPRRQPPWRDSPSNRRLAKNFL